MRLMTKGFCAVILLLMVSACNTLQTNHELHLQGSGDPFEGLNRSIYAFNGKADKLLLRPTAKAYSHILPKPVKTGVTHFFSNLGEPLNAFNNLLQGKYDRALSSVYRFTVNSTVGLLGLFDVAKHYDVELAREDLGQTLAAWGVAPGPYLMLPFLGPSNFRDGGGMVAHALILSPARKITDSNAGRTGLVFLDIVSTRARLLGSRNLLDAQLDPYAFLKRAFEQSRLGALYDGTPPEVEEEYDF